MNLLHKATNYGLILAFVAAIATAGPAWAQGGIPHSRRTYLLESGMHQGAESGISTAFSETIQFAGAPWLRLHFSDYNLGESSYITITSLADGGQQKLNTTSLDQWNNNSALFNGDAVRIELHVAAREPQIFFRIEEVTVGEWLDESESDYSIESLCGADNRTPSTEPRVARLTFVNAAGNPGTACTAWLISNGALLTAGHCVDFDPDSGGPQLPDGTLDLDGNDVIEFDVPNSQNNGTLVFAAPDDQYAINLNSVSWNFDGEGQGLGKDWAIFAVFPNANTGRLPHDVQGFYRMTNANPATNDTIRVTGHGTDNTPNSTRNQIQQTHSGPYVGESSSGANFWHRYQVDTTGGNSGSPIIWTNNGFTIGIHTNAGCAADGSGANNGTSFEHNALETAIDNFPGNNTVYVDLSRVGTLENGTIFHPYDTVAEAVNVVPSGGIVSVVEGTYTSAAGNTFVLGDNGRRMFIEAPVGSVLIGN